MKRFNYFVNLKCAGAVVILTFNELLQPDINQYQTKPQMLMTNIHVAQKQQFVLRGILH